MDKILSIVFICLSLLSTYTYARDDVTNYSIKDAMTLAKVKEKLGTDIAFLFGRQAHGKFSNNKKPMHSTKQTNTRVIGALINLKDRAKKEGGNAIVNIKSNYKGNLIISNDTFPMWCRRDNGWCRSGRRCSN